MAEESAEAEPTMEEILASIRRIIAEEGDEAEAEDDGADVMSDVDTAADGEAEAESDAEPEVAHDDDDDQIELEADPDAEPELDAEVDDTDGELDAEPEVEADAEVEADGEPDAETDVETEAADPMDAEPGDDEVLELDQPIPEEDLVEIDPEPEMEAEPEPEPVAAAEPAETIVSEPVADATAGAFGVLLNNIFVASRSQQGMTLDDLVRELLKPMLREWLDANLEDIVKTRVAEEVERITARARL